MFVLLPFLCPAWTQCLTSCRYSLNTLWINEWEGNIYVSIIKEMFDFWEFTTLIVRVFSNTLQEKWSLTYEYSYQVKIETNTIGERWIHQIVIAWWNCHWDHPNNFRSECMLPRSLFSYSLVFRHKVQTTLTENMHMSYKLKFSGFCDNYIFY